MRASQPLALLLVMPLFLSVVVFTYIIGDDNTARSRLVLAASTQAGLLGLLWSFLLGFKSGQTNQLLVLPKMTTYSLLLLGGTAIVSAALGLIREHQFSYVIGDLYKFIAVPLTIFGVAAVLSSRENLDAVMSWTVWIFAALLTLLCLAYITGALDIQRRPAFIYLYPFMPCLILHLRKSRPSGMLRLLLAFYAIAFPLVIWFTQSLGLLFFTIVLWLATYVFYARIGTMKALFVLNGFALSLIALGIATELMPLSRFTGFASSDFYLLRKLHVFTADDFGLDELERLGGDRIAQIVAVVQYFGAHPLEIFLGQGMGGTLVVEPISGIKPTANWKVSNHFVEGGAVEVALRTGLLGLIAYLGFFVSLVRFAWAFGKQQLVVALVGAAGFYFLLFSFYYASFVSQGLLFMLSLVVAALGIFNRNARARRPSSTARNPSNRRAVFSHVSY